MSKVPVELLNFTRNGSLDPPETIEDHVMNGDVTFDRDQDEFELVRLDKEGSGPPEYSVRFSHKALPSTDASETETETLLQKVIVELRVV